MVGLKDIVKAINSIIKSNFSGVEIQSEDIKEGFKRPSFFVDVDEDKSNSFMSIGIEGTTVIRIYYFPSDRYKNRIELLETQDTLKSLFFKGLQVNDNFNMPLTDDLHFTKTNGILQMDMTLYSIQEIIDDDDTPMMGDIIINSKIN